MSGTGLYVDTSNEYAFSNRIHIVYKYIYILHGHVLEL